MLFFAEKAARDANAQQKANMQQNKYKQNNSKTQIKHTHTQISEHFSVGEMREKVVSANFNQKDIRLKRTHEDIWPAKKKSEVL